MVAALALASCTGTPGPTASSPDGSAGPSMPSATTTLPIAAASETEAPLVTALASAGPGTSPTATASLPAPSGAWRPAPTQASLTGTQLQDVVWTGSRFEAVGGASFLDSVDGRTWRSATVGATNGDVSRIASGPGGLVVIGTVEGYAASWASTDAIHWSWHSRNFPTSLARGDVFRVTDVVATATGWLAVGREDPACNFNCGLSPVRGLAWISSDGLTWTRVTGQIAFDGGGIEAVDATDSGFVAVGGAGGHAAIWSSPDGLSWSRVADDPVFAPPSGAGGDSVVEAIGVAVGHGAIVAVGQAFDAGPGGAPVVMAWRSVDGASWTAASVAGATGGQVFSVAATVSRFLATGPSGDGSCLGGIWASSDGAGWACEATDQAFAGFGPYAAAGSPTIEVAVGLTSVGWDDSSGQGLPGAAWWRPAP